MRYSKRTRLSIVKPRRQLGGIPNRNEISQRELMYTSVQEELLRSNELKLTLERMNSVLEKETSLQTDIKACMLVIHYLIQRLTQKSTIPKFKVAIDPMFFASSRIQEDVKQFVIKTQNSVLKLNKDSKEQWELADASIACFGAWMEELNRLEAQSIDSLKKISEERARLSTSKTLEEIRSKATTYENERLKGELQQLENQINDAKRLFDSSASTRTGLEQLTFQLSRDIVRYNEEINMLEDGSTNQNQLARRMVQMHVLTRQETELQKQVVHEKSKKKLILNSIGNRLS